MSFKSVLPCLVSLMVCASPLVAAPNYAPDRAQLESVLYDLRAWLPGEWSSFPQVWYDRYVTTPAGGEHDDWYRTFALIEAPQVGATVFYGQVNLGGPRGPVLGRSQVLYKADIDEAKGVVTILGQPIADPDRYVDLHRKPELWSSARMRDVSALNCRFDWRRNGRQLVGILDNIEPAGPKEPGSCTYTAQSGLPFLADAEWVLSPDELWLYDRNVVNGVRIVGREDRTHLRLYRVTGYECTVTDAAGSRTVGGHDRGFSFSVEIDAGESAEAMLLRAWYPDERQGLSDRLRLVLRDSEGAGLAAADAPPGAAFIALAADAARVSCRRD